MNVQLHRGIKSIYSKNKFSRTLPEVQEVLAKNKGCIVSIEEFSKLFTPKLGYEGALLWLNMLQCREKVELLKRNGRTPKKCKRYLIL